MDTIFALASAPGKAGVAVVRISGPKAFAALAILTRDARSDRGMRLASIYDGVGQVLDRALVLGFPDGKSFTGENVVELQLHGSPAIVARVLSELSGVEGLRLADAGEFTRRALENGKLDLAEVEGLADLIEAETEAQRLQAMRVFSGSLGALAAGWRRSLIRAVALVDATIDFADEEIPTDLSGEVAGLLASVRTELTLEAEGALVAERVRNGFEVAILGAPNVGKSTLLNTISGRDAAITSNIAGTTRDVIEVRMDLRGLPVTFLDTAGLRESDDEIEKIGIARALTRAEAADLRVVLKVDGTPLPIEIGGDDIVVGAKGDLRGDEAGSVSGLSGRGVDELLGRVFDVLSERAVGVGSAIRERHRVAILGGVSQILTAEDLLQSGFEQSELIADAIHAAIRVMDALVGRVDVENVLDEIFLSFCIGK